MEQEASPQYHTPVPPVALTPVYLSLFKFPSPVLPPTESAEGIYRESPVLKYPGLNLLLPSFHIYLPLLLGSTYLPFYYKTTKIPYLIYYIQFISSTATTSHVPTISTITIMKIPKHLYSQIVTLLNTLLYSTQIK